MSQISPDVTNDCVLFEQVRTQMKCSIRCIKCGKLSALSPYFTQDGVGFRINNFARHVSTSHIKTPAEKALPMLTGATQIRKPALNIINRIRSEQVRSLKRKIQYIERSRRSSKRAMINDVTSTPSESPETQISCCDLSSSHAGLEAENKALKQEILTSRENFNYDIANLLREKEVLLQKLTSSNGSMEMEWQEKAKTFEKQLEEVRRELHSSQMERRDLLHSLLDLKGKVRVMARLCPVKKSSNMIQFKINANQTNLKCEYLN